MSAPAGTLEDLGSHARSMKPTTQRPTVHLSVKAASDTSFETEAEVNRRRYEEANRLLGSLVLERRNRNERS